MPNLERLQLLIDTLRSGKYAKGDGLLKRQQDDSMTYCCLGVGCELYAQENPGAEWREGCEVDPLLTSDAIFFRISFDADWSSVYWPREVARWFGLTNGPDIYIRDEHGESDTISNINDSSETFEPVIEALVRNFPGLR